MLAIKQQAEPFYRETVTDYWTINTCSEGLGVWNSTVTYCRCDVRFISTTHNDIHKKLLTACTTAVIYPVRVQEDIL